LRQCVEREQSEEGSALVTGEEERQ
jgi:hypothetical protein